MPLPEVIQEDVPALIPDAPQPGSAHLNLAAIWLAQELTVRGVSLDTTWTAAQATALKTVLAAKALSYQAGLSGAITLENVATNGAARVIEAVEVPDEIKVKYRAAMSGDQALSLAAGHWDALALGFLLLALPASTRLRRVFAGAAR